MSSSSCTGNASTALLGVEQTVERHALYLKVIDGVESVQSIRAMFSYDSHLASLQGKLPESIDDAKILTLSEEIEWRAHQRSRSGDRCTDQQQSYYKAASQMLLDTVMKNRPADADPGSCSKLQLPQLEPLSALRPHVARPPMDPR